MITALLAQAADATPAAHSWSIVADDAVKIGLGALIGGGSTIIGAIVSSRRKLREADFMDRREQLRSIGDRIERIVTRFRALAVVQNATAEWSDDVGITRAEFISVLGEDEGALRRDTLSGVHEMHEIEGRLRLLGLEQTADAVDSFRVFLGEIFAIDSVEPQQLDEVVTSYLVSLATKKIEVVTHLAKAYRTR